MYYINIKHLLNKYSHHNNDCGSIEIQIINLIFKMKKLKFFHKKNDFKNLIKINKFDNKINKLLNYLKNNKLKNYNTILRDIEFIK